MTQSTEVGAMLPAEEKGGGALSSIRVLLVDDEASVRKTFSLLLAREGYDLRAAESAEEALAVAREWHPDVLVSDILMPGMSGVELVAAVKLVLPNCQAILATAAPNIESAAEAVRLQAFDYLMKPVTGEALRRTVGRAAQVKVLLDRARELENEKVQYQQSLEETVETRTRELQQANTRLRREILVRRDTEEKLRSSVSELGEALDGTIGAMAAVVEKRDPYTAGHQNRVADLALHIARELGLPEEIVRSTYMAGMIHDVGKVAIPAELLSKPTALSAAEFSLIQAHPLSGYEIVSKVRFPWPIADIVHQHHERMDGSGYPDGLKGEQIAMQARIVAVADVVEAMAAHRPYRPALGVPAALDEIRKGAGRKYDDNVARVCLHLFEHGGYQIM